MRRALPTLLIATLLAGCVAPVPLRVPGPVTVAAEAASVALAAETAPVASVTTQTRPTQRPDAATLAGGLAAVRRLAEVDDPDEKAAGPEEASQAKVLVSDVFLEQPGGATRYLVVTSVDARRAHAVRFKRKRGQIELSLAKVPVEADSGDSGESERTLGSANGLASRTAEPPPDRDPHTQPGRDAAAWLAAHPLKGGTPRAGRRLLADGPTDFYIDIDRNEATPAVPCVQVADGEHFVAWMPLAELEAASGRGAVVAKAAAELGRVFDEQIFGTVTTAFGDAPAPDGPGGDTDGDARIQIVFGADLGDASSLGYFHGFDQITPERGTVPPASNQKDVIFINASVIGTEDGTVTELVNTVAHELQHLIHAHQKLWVQGDASGMAAFLDEGFAMQAANLVNAGVRSGSQFDFYNLRDWLLYDADALLLWGYGITGGQGPANAFVTYLVDRFGLAILREVINAKGTGAVALNRALKRHGSTFADTMGDWSLATLLDKVPNLVAPAWRYRGLTMNGRNGPFGPGGEFEGLVLGGVAEYEWDGASPMVGILQPGEFKVLKVTSAAPVTRAKGDLYVYPAINLRALP